jgi:hypothetical protein
MAGGLTAESSSPLSLLSGVASQLAAVSSVTVPLRTSGVAGRNCEQRETENLSLTALQEV